MDTGAVQSALAPRTLFLWFDKKHPANEHVTLTGIAGTHVDDDLFAGTDWWRAHVLPVVRRTFSYGKWANGQEPYIHLGRRVTQTPQKVILDQEQYALGLRQIEVKKERRALKDEAATPLETTALRASSGKVAWVLKTRSDVSSQLTGVQQQIATATVSTIHDHNKMVIQCVRDSHLTLEFVPIRFWEESFGTFSVSDSSFMNMLEDIEEVPKGEEPQKTDCQQGFFSLVGNEDEVTGRVAPVNVVLWRTHKARRKNRSTLGAETGAMSEGVNATEMVRGHFAEIMLGRPLTLRPRGYPARTYEQDIKCIRLTAVTDCRSLYDNVTGIGRRPAEVRLSLDIGAIKSFHNVVFRWVRDRKSVV